jgi:hypothetical protein
VAGVFTSLLDFFKNIVFWFYMMKQIWLEHATMSHETGSLSKIPATQKIACYRSSPTSFRERCYCRKFIIYLVSDRSSPFSAKIPCLFPTSNHYPAAESLDYFLARSFGARSLRRARMCLKQHGI